MDWTIGLDWTTGLDWTGLDYTDWTGLHVLDWTGLHVLDWTTGLCAKDIITPQDSYLGLWNRSSSFGGLGAGFLIISCHVSIGDFDNHENLNIHSYYNTCLLFRQLYHFIAMFCLSFTCSIQVTFT